MIIMVITFKTDSSIEFRTLFYNCTSQGKITAAIKLHRSQRFDTFKAYFLLSAQRFAEIRERAPLHLVIQGPRLLPSNGSMTPQCIEFLR